MKKLYLIIIAITLICLLSSCSISKFETKDKIKSPQNKLPPLLGKWIAEKTIDGAYPEEIGEMAAINKEALFHETAVVIGEDYVLDPVYKLKNVILSDYLLYKYKMSPEDLDLEDREVQIVTIFSDNQFFNEFIRYNDEEILSFIQDKFYFFKKTVDKISREEIHRYINIEKSITRISPMEEVDTLRTGILLGIKSHINDENQKENWNYKTIWIRTNNRNTSSIYELNDLLLPRKKGFWLVNVNRENNNDKISAIQKGKFKEELNDESFSLFRTSQISMESRIIEPSILKNILYVGNDYISTENIDLLNNRKTIQVYPVDYLNDEKAIKISDIIGEDGLKSFTEGAQGIIKANSNIELNEESFGLFRRNGHWIMKGRINYIIDNEELYNDFNIKAIPPKELVNYDELSISWSMIKSKVPEAIDAFTSPNEDIILIVTRNNIFIYGINDHEISQKEIGKIKISSADSIVMAEWALGRYTMIWEEEIIKNGAENIYP